MEVAVRWPLRTTQVIPLSAETIWLRVEKDGEVLQDVLIPRPEEGTESLVATSSFFMDAVTGLQVFAAAFQAGQATADVPIASDMVAGVDLYPNQRTVVTLDLKPAVKPLVSSFSPSNGGPGAPVVVRGAFGASGYYQLAIGQTRRSGSLDSDGNLVASVPAGALTGPLSVLADGVPSAEAGTFRVLSALALAPFSAKLKPGQQLTFAAAALDTKGVAVSSPAITRWELLDPEKFSLPGSPESDIGTLTPEGAFTATSPGVAWIYAWSGYLFATASVTVE